MTDFMPDFDNMTQEQINEWMESLARRQGATEGFTTAASMDVPEIDPSTVDQSLLEDTYIPYGWTREQWEAHLQKEKAAKQSRVAASTAAPSPTPAPAAPPQAAPAPMMSEQQLTEYIMSLDLEQQMELLTEMGKSQRGEPNRLAELLPAWDSSSVDESKLGKYRPGYMSEEEWEAYQAKEAARQQAAPPPVSPPVTDVGDVLKPPSLDDLFTPAEEPQPQPTAALEDPLQWLSQLGEAAPEVAALPSVSFEELNQNLVDLPQPQMDDPLEWLSSLSDLGTVAPQQPIDDLDTGVFNLKNLADLAESVATSQAVASDEITWLESLARASGADMAELVTAADVPLPPPSAVPNDGPGYQPYSFEAAFAGEAAPVVDDSAVNEVSVPDVNSFDDPELWLDAIAAGVNAQREEAEAHAATNAPTIPEDPMEVMRALNAGVDVPPEAVESFFEKMIERAEQLPDEPEALDADAPAIEVEIPDWLKDAFATMEQEATVSVEELFKDVNSASDIFNTDSTAFEAQFSAPTPLDWQAEFTDAPDPINLTDLIGLNDESFAEETVLPDWIVDQTDEMKADMSDIFADENTVPVEIVPPQDVLSIDDPWVRAFAEESTRPEALEAWYQSRVAQISNGEPPAPEAEATPPAPVLGVGVLQPAQLPVEAELEHAIPVNVPMWLLEDEPHDEPPIVVADEWLDTREESIPIPTWIQEQVAEPVSPDLLDPLPDWLRGADIGNAEVPAWLLETVTDSANDEVEQKPLPVVEVPPPAPTRPAQPAVIERPKAPAAPAEVAAHLAQARQQLAANIDASLQHYEAVVRANAALNEVVQDLSRVLNDKAHKNNPAVYRVLGDALMRQGKLQDALSTYRKALNLLG